MGSITPFPGLRIPRPDLPELPRPDLAWPGAADWPDLPELGDLSRRLGLPERPEWPEWPDPAAAVGAGVAEARRRLATSVRRMIAGDAPARNWTAGAGDAGLFGPDSVTWRVHADAAMFIGGLRALLLQTMHPLAMAGVADHSDYRHDPIGRLWRTSIYVATTTYGSTAEAEAAVAMVKRVHARVRGTAPDGRPYEANDPHLVTWVHHAEVASFLAAYRRYGAEPLTDADADRYVDEMAVLCELFDAEPAARSVAELDAYFHCVQHELRATAQAREAARWLMVPPLPWAARPAYSVIAPAAVGLLPASVRRALWLPMPPGFDPLVVRPAARALTRSIGWVMGGLEREGAPAGPVDDPAIAGTQGPDGADAPAA